MEAQAHPRQEDRLRVLRSFDILDTETEPEFDAVTKLASAICDAPISVINLIDRDRQWFKSEVGLGVRETPLATSLCSHVILQNDFVQINDTLSDPRMMDNPLCCGEPGLRFYAGGLLKSDDGLPLGTLCVLDYQPRELSELQCQAIRVLADQVMAQLNLRRSLRQSDILRREVDHRAKNSLAVLGSLTRLKERSATSPETKAALSDMSGRIETVSMVHDQLYRASADGTVDLSAFLEHLTEHLRGICPANVSLSAQVDRIEGSSKQASALGILVNEAVTNALKHAFPDGQGGVIALSLKQSDDGMAVLEIRDTGIGIDTDLKISTGLGVKIAEAATSDLDGDLIITAANPGTRLTASFMPDAT